MRWLCRSGLRGDEVIQGQATLLCHDLNVLILVLAEAERAPEPGSSRTEMVEFRSVHHTLLLFSHISFLFLFLSQHQSFSKAHKCASSLPPLFPTAHLTHSRPSTPITLIKAPTMVLLERQVIQRPKLLRVDGA